MLGLSLWLARLAIARGTRPPVAGTMTRQGGGYFLRQNGADFFKIGE